MMDSRHLTTPRPGKTLRVGRLLLNFNWARTGLWACKTTKGETRTELVGLCIVYNGSNRAASLTFGPIKITGGILK